MITKRQFISLAQVIKDDLPDFSDSAIERLAEWCQAENPRFNRERWLGYIHDRNGPNGGKVHRCMPRVKLYSIPLGFD